MRPAAFRPGQGAPAAPRTRPDRPTGPSAPPNCPRSWRHPDHRYLPAVVRFAAVRRPPIAEEAVGVGVCVEPERLDAGNPRRLQPLDDIGFEVEMRLVRRPGSKKSLIAEVGVKESGAKPFVHLVRIAPDARSNRCGDSLAPGAQILHRGDDRIGDSGERPAPAGMRGSDDPRL